MVNLVKLKNIPAWLVLTILVSLLTLIPFAKAGLPLAHDSWIQVQKNQQFAKALSEGQFPVRIAPDFGYKVGYPIFDFMYPLPMYLGSILNLFNIGYTDGVKILIIFSMILSALGMYLLSSKFWGRIGGFVSATIYTFAPYHAVDLYVRGSVGELMAMAIAPFILYFSFRLIENKTKKDFIINAFLIALLVLSHNITALIFFPLILFAILFYAFLKKDVKSLIPSLLSLVLGVLITSYFWFPALYDKQYIIVDQVYAENFNYPDHFIYPVQLFLYSPWGFGGSQPGPIDGMSFKIEKQFLVIYIFSAITILYFTYKKQKVGYVNLIFLGFGILAGFLTLTVSQPFWESVPLIYLIQFPWRFLTLLIFCFGVIAGSLVMITKHRDWQVFTALIVCLGIVITSINLFKPGPGEYLNDDLLLDKQFLESTTTTRADEFRPKWVNIPPSKPFDSPVETTNSMDLISGLETKSNHLKFTLQNQLPTTVKVNKYYYPGWRVYIDQQEHIIDPASSNGFIQFPIAEGEHLIELKFKETPTRAVANYISVSFFMLSLLMMLVVKNKQWKRLMN